MSEEALFGRWLQRRRNSMQLTQRELGELAGCSAATIRKIEADERRPSLRVARALAESLHVPEDERNAFFQFARSGWSHRPSPSPRDPLTPLPWNDSGETGSKLLLAPSKLLGRDRELQEAIALLHQPHLRLMTLTGPGGTGKTRLALEIALHLSQEFAHGVHVAALAPLRNPHHLPSAIAHAVGVQESGARPVWESVVAHLEEKELLLVLDNFEQIISAAPMVSALVQSCPRVRVLVTSREVLRVAGEQEFPVSPLRVPDPDLLTTRHQAELAAYPAVEMFVQRAKEARPDFALTPEHAPAVAEICLRLDGLPLAIELAAARVRLLSPEAMLARLPRRLDLLTDGARDAPERQRTMRRTIDWSYRLLTSPEQLLLRTLSVFSGGFALDAAEAVAQPEHSLLDTLGSLVQKSLLRLQRSDEPRYAMLETIREFASDELMAHEGDLEVRRRHAEYFIALMERVQEHLHGSDQARWMQLVSQEHANVRVALRWTLDSGASDMAIRLVTATWWYWYVQGHVAEGRAALREVLAQAGGDSACRPGALIGAARLAVRQNDDEEADELYAEAERLSRARDDRDALARALQGRARVATHRGEYSLARRLAEEALALARELGKARDEALSLNELGEIARSEGDYASAADHYERSLAILRSIGDKVPMVSLLSNVGYVAQRHGDLPASASSFRDGLKLAQEVRDMLGIATTIAGLAGVASRQGLAERAAVLFGASARVHEAAGVEPDPVDRAEMDRNVAHAQRQLPAERWISAHEEGTRLNVDEAIRRALAVEATR